MAIVVSVIILCLRFCLSSSLTADELYGDGAKPDCPVIKTTLGNIAGIRQRTVLGHSSFCSYRGIRYAEAPIGELRFKAPVFSASWNGTYDATDYGSACLQFDSNYTKQSEDCLFLNVFVPEPSICTNSSDIAVIVYVHGGGFVNEAADDNYGPHLLLNECVILVTFNYRLDVFGFLPLALPEYSGNMGLKDQQLALEWVNRHISAFGGNPERVTLMGQSAGGASVSFQRLNPKSRRYYKRAYVMSGSALSYYALSSSNNKTDLIVEIAKSQSITIENPVQLINFLQTVDARLLLINPDDYLKGCVTCPGLWQPCVEPETAFDPFITVDPELLLSAADDLPPTVYTYTSMEAISMAADIIAKPDLISILDTNFTLILPFHGLNQVACEKEVAPILTQIRRFYFGHAKINGSQMLPFMQLLSFNNYLYPILKEMAIQALSKSSTEIRLLRMNLRTLLSPSVYYPEAAALAGTSHFDDVCSYFWCKCMKDIYEEIATEETLAQQSTLRTSRILREILTSFANDGIPVSETAPFRSFPPVDSNPLTNLAFTELLSISSLASGSNPDHEQFQFWWKINQKVDEIKGLPCNQN